MPKAAKESKPDKEDEKMQALFDFYKSNKSYTSAGVTDEHSYFRTKAGKLGRLKLENVGGDKPLSTLHSSCGSSQSASLQVPSDAKQFDFSSETCRFKTVKAASKGSPKAEPQKGLKRVAEKTPSPPQKVAKADSAELSKLHSAVKALEKQNRQLTNEKEAAAQGREEMRALAAGRAAEIETLRTRLATSDTMCRDLTDKLRWRDEKSQAAGTKGCVCSWKQRTDPSFTKKARRTVAMHMLLPHIHPDKEENRQKYVGKVSETEAEGIHAALTDFTALVNGLLRF